MKRFRVSSSTDFGPWPIQIEVAFRCRCVGKMFLFELSSAVFEVVAVVIPGKFSKVACAMNLTTV